MCQHVQVKYACGCRFGRPVVVLPACDDLPEPTPHCTKWRGPDRVLKYACFNCKNELPDLYGGHLWSGGNVGGHGDGNESDSSVSEDGNGSDRIEAACKFAAGWFRIRFPAGRLCRSWFTDDGHLRSVVEVN